MQISAYFPLLSAMLKLLSNAAHATTRPVIAQLTLCCDHAGLSQSEIAALFGMPSGNAVAQTIRRIKAMDAPTLSILKSQISHK
jgi:hypothetical protein